MRSTASLPRALGLALLLAGPQFLAAPATAQERAAEPMTFDIPAQPLDQAVTELASRAGLSIGGDAALLSGKQAPALKGEYTPRQALERLLAGTGVAFRFTGSHVVTLVKADALNDDGPVQLDPIAVVGLVSDKGRAGLLGERLIRDTPFSITSFTKTTIENQQAKAVSDVVENDPSVRNTVNRSSNSDQFQIRGFPIFNTALAVDGLFGLSDARQMHLEAFEQVEVFKGPNTLANGVPATGQIAGVINLVPKRPTREPLTDLTLNYESEGHVGPHLDVSRRFGPNDAFGVRFNGVYRNGDLEVDNASRELSLASLALEYNEGGRLRANADLYYRDQTVDSPVQLVFLSGNDFSVPDAPEADSNTAQPYERTSNENYFALLGVEYDLGSNWTARLRYGHSRSEEDRLSSLPFVNDAAGNTNNRFLASGFRFDADTAEAGLTGFFDTGPIAHELAIVFNRLEQERFTGSSYGFESYSSNLYEPASFPEPSSFPDPPREKAGEITFDSAGISDVIRLWNDRLQLTGGVRYQRLDTTTFRGGKETVADEKFSPAGGIVFKPSEPWSIYASYSQGLAPGRIVPGVYANSGEQLPAFVTEQIEAGVKADFGGVGGSVTVFEITQPLELADADTQILTQNGEIRNRGLEFNMFGEVVKRLRLLGGVTYMDGEQTSTEGGVNDGNDAVGIPEVQLNLYGEYDLTGPLQGATLTGRVIHTSDQFVDAGNQQSIPDWTRVDLGARYETALSGTPLIVRLDVRNLLDEDYWSSAARGSLSRGTPRTFLVSTSFRF